MNLLYRSIPSLLTISSLLFTGCGLLDDLISPEEPTFSKMRGIWKITEAYNDGGESILKLIDFPITVIKLDDDNSVISTAGPMITYMVYGPSRYVNVTSKIDQIFDYTNLNFTDGEWFIDKSNHVTRFTLLMKLKCVPGATAVEGLLRLLGVNISVLDQVLNQVIYHKFEDVLVTFESNDVMIWEFDEKTIARYFTKDSKGYDIPALLSTDNFSHCRFVLTKQVKDLEDLITEAKNPN